jgi:fission process protein 1
MKSLHLSHRCTPYAAHHGLKINRGLSPPQASNERHEGQLGSKESPANTCPDASRDKVNIEMFETAGTAEERRPWEPFGDGSTPGPIATLLSNVDFSEPTSFDGEEKTEYDPLRDGPLRYLGYANELGEAFAAWLFPGGVSLSYAVAIGYVLFDTVDKYNKTLREAREKLTAREKDLPADLGVDIQRLANVIGAERGIDTLVWQLIASVAAPGYTIHTVVAAVMAILHDVERYPGTMNALQNAATLTHLPAEYLVDAVNKSVPTAMGLLAIPFIVHPIDAAVHAVLNATLRPAMRDYICNQAGGGNAGLAVCNCKTK